jgi:hypothetical protein
MDKGAAVVQQLVPLKERTSSAEAVKNALNLGNLVQVSRAA